MENVTLNLTSGSFSEMSYAKDALTCSCDSAFVSAHIRRSWMHNFADWYSAEFVSKAHPEILRWPLVESDGPCVLIMLSYSLFVNWLGPALMRQRRPFDLRWLMVPYNALLVAANFYIFYEFAKIRWSGNVQVRCETLAKSLGNDPHTYRLAEVTWYFYITKYVELLDTVFFVLRKKDRQLSRLHIIHHTTVPIAILMLLRSEPGGYNSFFPLANSFVHCVMYTYYGISAVGDDVTIHLKFKKYVTMTQMIQFILVLCYFISRPFYGCTWHPVLGGANLFVAGFFFILFCNFYWHEYRKKKPEEEEAAKLRENGVKSKAL